MKERTKHIELECYFTWEKVVQGIGQLDHVKD